MSMGEKCIIIKNEPNIPYTHFFIYRNKKYPFNFDFFKYNSNHFLQNQNSFQQSLNINLINDDDENTVNLSDESINNFIAFCHNKEIQISNQNVICINYLANKYEIPSLIKSTDDYIAQHTDELALPMMSLIQNQQNSKTEKYEDMLAENLDNLINDDQLFTLSIPVLHRILAKYHIKNKKPNISFLLKCLDKFGREASVLFSNLDFGDQKADVINSLLTNYSNVFDFNFINSQFAKTLYETQNEIVQKNMQIEKQQKEIMSFVQDQMKQMKDEMNKMQEKHTKEMSEMQTEHNREMSKLQDEYSKTIQMQKQEEERIIGELNEKINKMSQEINAIIDENKGECLNRSKSNDKYFNLLMKNINVETFNQLDGETQIFVINEIASKNRSKVISQIQNIISFISSEFQRSQLILEGKNKIFIPVRNADEKIVNMNDLDEQINKIGISDGIIEVLNKNGTLNSNEFKSRLDIFDQSFLEVRVPSPYLQSFIQNKSPKTKIIMIISNIIDRDIKMCNSDAHSIIIKEPINKLPKFFVTGFTSLVKVIIPSSVTSIESCAFEKCSMLTQISIPSSVKSIGGSTFWECSSLVRITIPSSVTVIEAATFFRCTSLSQVSLPSSLTSIKKNAFKGCSSLNNIFLPSSINSIEYGAFSECGILSQISLPSSLTMINPFVFDKCASLVKVTIPQSILAIKDSAFKMCPLLQSIKIPDSVTSIGNYAFNKCSSLQSIEIPNSVISIGSYAFNNCLSLQSIKIPSSVQSIGKYAFYNCTSLQSIEFPPSAVSIGAYSFFGCILLQSIEIPSSTSFANNSFPPNIQIITKS